MDQCTLYQQILGLSSPWFVSGVELDKSQGEVVVQVDLDRSAKLVCPRCARTCPGYDSRERRWRHLDTCQFRTQVVAQVPRVQCPEHGCLTISVPWAEQNSRYTLLFEAFVISWLKAASISAVSKQLRLSWTAIDNIMDRAVRRGLANTPNRDTTRLAVDETAFRKGHDYVTIVSNAEGQVLAVEDGRSSDSLGRFYESLKEPCKQSIISISMDMSPAYQKATFDHIEKAHRKIAFDHFHVAQMLTRTLDATRKADMARADRSMRQEIHRSRYTWLRHRKSLEGQQVRQIRNLSDALKDTGLVWYLKEKARDIWQGYRVKGARSAWLEWVQMARLTEVRALASAANQIETKLFGILNAMRFRASNGLAEAINGQIRTLKVRSRGFRSKERFKRAILFHYGGLPMAPNPHG
ncbi:MULTISPECIES: ISL3 family transposase [Marinobacter]|uniref:ISL3 family transposase n=1 Tax=Marinobacter TaxID=2742 RepID=UPI001D063AC9|nr:MULTISPECIES: ISL3 family transposase [Marinobacter]MCK7569196.1 ISL3 family transposase [Marinobacter xestospongiae]UDL05457.1 ISL3 family transposase [Marinobacter sp. CA1]